MHRIFDTFVHACEDYSTDNRGDVGSWVRQAAMLALELFAQLVTRAQRVWGKHPHSAPFVLSGMHGWLVEGALVQTEYGQGTVEAVFGEHTMCVVRFEPSSSATARACFPYGNACFRKDRVRPLAAAASQEHTTATTTTTATATDAASLLCLPPFDAREKYLVRDPGPVATKSTLSQTPFNPALSAEYPPLAPCGQPVLWGSLQSERLVGVVLKQLSEKLDMVRACAGQILYRLLVEHDTPPPAGLLAHTDEVT